ncbi:MAG: ribose 5-phosphate isomerase B [Bacteroidia bacterium]|jgi:ribose 5-phosphate isomerase B
MKIYIGSDHAGFLLKEQVKVYLTNLNADVTDVGTFSEESMDYPDIAHPVANAVLAGEADYGILLCGSANGVAISANKHAGIRAALCWLPEIAMLARAHNNANILCLPARFINQETAQNIVDDFLKTAFEGGRHEKRVAKINC